MSLDECYRVLGVSASANTAEVTRAFRRLAKRYHPDVNPEHEGDRHFVEVTKAYHTLRQRLRVRPATRQSGRCPFCGRDDQTIHSAAGIRGCADCLLGRTFRRRFLPLPVVVVARHVSVFVLYAACVFFLVLYLQTQAWNYAVTSLLAVTSGLLLLASEVMAIVGVQATSRRPRTR